MEPKITTYYTTLSQRVQFTNRQVKAAQRNAHMENFCVFQQYFPKYLCRDSIAGAL